MKKITVFLALLLAFFAMTPVYAANFYWKASTTDLNAIAAPSAGDRGIVITDAGVVSYWTYSGSAWVQANSTFTAQTANTVLSGPATGDPAAPGFRALVAGDLPELGAIFAAATSKTTPVDADELPLSDSAASGALKALSWANLKATLKTYFDGLYAGLYSAQDSITWGTSSGGSQTWTWDTGSGTDPSMTVADDSFTFGKKLVAPGFETNAADGTHHMNVDNSASYSGTTQGDIYSIAGVPYVYRTAARQIWDAASVPYPAQGTSATPTAGRITKWDSSGRVLLAIFSRCRSSSHLMNVICSASSKSKSDASSFESLRSSFIIHLNSWALPWTGCMPLQAQ